jgi:hypothetical protein
MDLRKIAYEYKILGDRGPALDNGSLFSGEMNLPGPVALDGEE